MSDDESAEGVSDATHGAALEFLKVFNTLTPEQQKRARTAPVVVFVGEFFRRAAACALAIIILDATRWLSPSVLDDAIARLFLVGFSSAGLTAVQWVSWYAHERNPARAE